MGDPACGFSSNEHAMVYDDNANWDLFTVGTATDIGCPNPPCGIFTTASVTHTPAALNFTYFPTAQVAGIQVNTYYLNHATNKLMHSDGFTATDDVVLDDVVNLRFDYFGEADPPQILVEPTMQNITYFGVPGGAWTTYGPMPPLQGVQGVGCNPAAPGTAPNCAAGPTAFPEYAAGENCVFHINNGTGKHFPALPELNDAPGTAAAAGAGELVPLNDGTINPNTMFNDGPWCGHAASPNRFDADLLRIRKVRVTLRLQSPVTALRGPASSLFTNGGTAMAPKWVPDQEIRFDVMLNNFSFSR
jgi:hypothetical protein